MTKNTTENPPEKMEGNDCTNEPVYTPGPNAIDVSPKQDKGVLKEIIRAGTGDETPRRGDTVFVHYTGKLMDGTVFDSSRERDVFQFVLGIGTVIEAWDVGVATMKKDEKCILMCKPEYAYKAAGSPPKIPPNATLIFEVELFKWELEDLSPNKDNGILKSLITKGEGVAMPEDDATVQVHFVGKYKDAVFEEQDLSFTLDDVSELGVVEGLGIAIKKLTKGETALFHIAGKYAFGKQGKSEFNIPPDATVQYEVTLKSFENPKQSWSMDTDEKLEQSEIVKNKGTNYFKKEKYDVALKYYQKIVSYLEYESDLDEEKGKLKLSLLLAGHLNSAACNLKLEKYSEAINDCEKALTIDPKNVKGLFRKGQARMGVREYDTAKVDFRSVVDIDPNNKAALQQIAFCNAKLKQILDKEKKAYRNMFEKFAKEDTKDTGAKGDSVTIQTPDSTTEGDLKNEIIETNQEVDSTIDA